MTKQEQQNSNSEVVPLIHVDNNTRKENYDRTGFLKILDGTPVLVTCAHDFSFNPNHGYYFIYNEKKYLIEHKSEKFLWGENKEIRPTYDLNTSKRPAYIDDYAFYVMPGFSIINPITLGSTVNVSEEENLLLITHDPDTRDQIRIPCKRSDNLEYASIHGQQGIPGDFENLIHLTCGGCKPGHSGGVIFRPGKNECIGMLRSAGIDETVSILKGQSILERYKTFPSTH